MMRNKKFCAHRGLSALMPENTLPAFAASLAFGADEIEFDVRLTKDAQLIVSHDNTLERISDGTGKLREHTLSELRELNIGVKHGWQVGFCTPEEVFALLANKIRFNIHLKEHGEEGYLIKELCPLGTGQFAVGVHGSLADTIHIALRDHIIQSIMIPLAHIHIGKMVHITAVAGTVLIGKLNPEFCVGGDQIVLGMGNQTKQQDLSLGHFLVQNTVRILHFINDHNRLQGAKAGLQELQPDGHLAALGRCPLVESAVLIAHIGIQAVLVELHRLGAAEDIGIGLVSLVSGKLQRDILFTCGVIGDGEGNNLLVLGQMILQWK